MFHSEAADHVSWLVLGALLSLAGCGGDEPLVCPAGTVPMAGSCVSLDASTSDGAVSDDASVEDADVDDDADLPCVPSEAPDLPDAERIDSDCDGIDGAITASVFVASDGDDSASGTPEAPVATIARAIAIALMDSRPTILVAEGTYAEPIELTEGINLHGGYVRDGWSRDGARPIFDAQGPVLRGTDIVEPTRVSFLRIESRDATEPSGNSIAVHLVRSSGVRLEDSVIVAGRGGDGVSQTRPPAGGDGDQGGSGGASRANGSCPPGVVTSSTPPARGVGGARTCGCGDGGDGGSSNGFSGGSATGGQDGALAEPFLAACPAHSGASGGAAGSGGGAGLTGTAGANGLRGSDGTSGLGLGAFDETGYVAADGQTGTAGGHGAGGGGGGGANGCTPDGYDLCTITGGAGGGGGAGGCGGAAGAGGSGGGASIGIYLWESSPDLVRVDVTASSGGAGGAGARGGAGGAGGLGGTGGAASSSCGGTSRGGAGGVGGAGGEGGGGGGGGGGPSLGLVLAGGSSQGSGSTGNTFATGTGGVGGAGGGSAPAGENGAINPTLSVSP